MFVEIHVYICWSIYLQGCSRNGRTTETQEGKKKVIQ